MRVGRASRPSCTGGTPFHFVYQTKLQPLHQACKSWILLKNCPYRECGSPGMRLSAIGGSALPTMCHERVTGRASPLRRMSRHSFSAESKAEASTPYGEVRRLTQPPYKPISKFIIYLRRSSSVSTCAARFPPPGLPRVAITQSIA
jgi:hypothetical protein